MEERIELIRRMLSVSLRTGSLHALELWKDLKSRSARPYHCSSTCDETPNAVRRV
jgi:hypothetical protein